MHGMPFILNKILDLNLCFVLKQFENNVLIRKLLSH